jgi:hypothetical protein
MANKISSQSPFKGQPNVRRGAGPLNYKWNATPFQKNSRVQQKQTNVKCDNVIDNITTYVYDVLPDGNHLAYVYCDYVV